MVPIGDDHRSAADSAANGFDPLGFIHPPDAVADSVGVELDKWRFSEGEEIGESSRGREAPDR